MTNVECDITVQDHDAFVRFVRKQPAAGYELAVILVGVPGLFLLLWAGFHFAGHQFDLASAMGGFVGLIAVALVGVAVGGRKDDPIEGGVVLGPKRVELTDEGIVSRDEHSVMLFRWPVICKVVVTGSHVFVMVDRMVGLIVPRRCLGEKEQVKEFVREVTARSPRLITGEVA